MNDYEPAGQFWILLRNEWIVILQTNEFEQFDDYDYRLPLPFFSFSRH